MDEPLGTSFVQRMEWMLIIQQKPSTIPTSTDSPSLTTPLAATCGPMLLVSLDAVSVSRTTTPHSHHPLWDSIITVMDEGMTTTGTQTTLFGIGMAVPLATPAVIPQTCRGSTEHSTQVALPTLKCAGAKMKLKAMKTWEWNSLSSTLTDLHFTL